MIKRSKNDVPRDESADFRDAVKDVTPLARRGRVERAAKRPEPLPLQRLEDDRQVLQDSLSEAFSAPIELEAGDALAFLRDGLAPHVLRKLRAGHWAVQDEVDLHGLRSNGARAVVAQFLNGADRRGLRCVRIVHGRGLRSPGREPVLKGKVAGWLAQRGEVLAYCEARPDDGGAGAVMVLLRSSRPSPSGETNGDDTE